MAQYRKILVVLPTLNGGGAERVVLNLLRFLDRRKYRITLFLFKREGIYWSEIPRDVDVVYSTLYGHRYLTFPWVLLKLLLAAKKHDLIISGLELLPTYLSYLAGKLANRPVVGWVHTDFSAYIYRLNLLHRPMLRYVYPRLDKVVFVSCGALKSMKKILGNINVEHFQFIPNIFDLNIFKHKSENIQLSKKIFEIPVVISIGRFVEEKGFDILLKAHAQLLERGKVHNLLILGDGPLRQSLKDLATSLGVAETVYMPGFVSNPIPWLKRSYFFVLSSRFEGAGMVLLEAMSLGLPVIATDCPSGPAEILGGGKYGLLVAPEDYTALADAMSSLFLSEIQYTKYAKRSKARVRDYSPENVTVHWNKLIKEILK